MNRKIFAEGLSIAEQVRLKVYCVKCEKLLGFYDGFPFYLTARQRLPQNLRVTCNSCYAAEFSASEPKEEP